MGDRTEASLLEIAVSIEFMLEGDDIHAFGHPPAKGPGPSSA
jgi:hypothetical protein